MSTSAIPSTSCVSAAGFPPAPPEAHQKAGPRDVHVEVITASDTTFAQVTTKHSFVSFLVRSGMSPSESLRASAADLREEAGRLIARAQLASLAAAALDQRSK